MKRAISEPGLSIGGIRALYCGRDDDDDCDTDQCKQNLEYNAERRMPAKRSMGRPDEAHRKYDVYDE